MASSSLQAPAVGVVASEPVVPEVVGVVVVGVVVPGAVVPGADVEHPARAVAEQYPPQW